MLNPVELNVSYALRINLSKVYFIFVPLALPKLFFLFIFSDNDALIQKSAQAGKLEVVLTSLSS